MQNDVAADVVIFGGGVAGLWLLNRLQQAGLSAFLFESGSLGGGQTHKAQGIIHGGMKYALQGVMTKEADALAHMPQLWHKCLIGQGEIDLSQVPVLSAKHYLWAPTKLTSKLTGFLASTALASKVEPLLKENYPSVFQHPAFKGEVFSLDEIVIDVPALVRELVKMHQDAIFKIDPLTAKSLQFDDQGKLESATISLSGKSLTVRAQGFVFTAGTGNEVIIQALTEHPVAMQRRPLHMVLAKMPFDYPLYAHCLGFGSRPRVTITTHRTEEGYVIWYLGGLLAEEGVHRNSSAQIAAARKELQELFPWLDFAAAEFATFMVDRAEAKQGNGFKPDSCYTKAIENIIIAWPTKLALAPRLASDIMQQLQNMSITPAFYDARELRAWPIPPLARPVWEELFCKNVA